jgi:hypothetical protein
VEPMVRNSLQRGGPVRTILRGDQFRNSLIALRKTVARVGRSIAPSIERQYACPKCHWTCALASRRRTGLDSLLGMFRLRPFRCRSCRTRYYRLSF